MCDRQSMKTQIEREKIKHNKSNQIKKKQLLELIEMRDWSPKSKFLIYRPLWTQLKCLDGPLLFPAHQ